jgi:hypothetical protein
MNAKKRTVTGVVKDETCDGCGGHFAKGSLKRDSVDAALLYCDRCSDGSHEWDVHFSINGFFRKVEGETPEKAMQTAEVWLGKKRAELEKVLGVGIGIEVVEAVGDED